MLYISGIITFSEIGFTIPDCEFQNVEYCYSFMEGTNLFTNNNVFKATLIDFSWGSCFCITDGVAYLFGYHTGKFGHQLTLRAPDNSRIIQGCCTSTQCHLVTDSGGYWCYIIRSGEWRNIAQLLSVEASSSSSLKSDETVFVQKISCQDHLTIAITSSGIYSVPSLLTFPKVIVLEVSSGKEHTVILTEHGNVFTWGNGSRGQLGHGELEIESNPREVRALSGLKVTAVAAGGWHSCAVTEQGDLYTWGWNSCGQLGFPGVSDKSSGDKEKCVSSVQAEPMPVDWPLVTDASVKQVACGSRHTIVMLNDKTIWGCGWNKYGQLDKHKLPEKVFGMSKIDVPESILKNLVNIVCREWNTAFITT